MKVAIMQPYIFPYLGYFQLIKAVDTFVFYDDVNFIKKGWVNRNKILVNGKEGFITVPLKKASQNKLIKDIDVLIDEVWLQQFFKTLEQNYKKAPYFESTYKLIKAVFEKPYTSISDLAILSVMEVSYYLGIDISFKESSIAFPETMGHERAKRLQQITQLCRSSHYVNPQGGKILYNKMDFKLKGVTLSFIDNQLLPYKQYNHEFVNGLSIIDVLMFNSKAEVKKMLNNYQLI
jgi:hypothetical protein